MGTGWFSVSFSSTNFDPDSASHSAENCRYQVRPVRNVHRAKQRHKTRKCRKKNSDNGVKGFVTQALLAMLSLVAS